MCLIIFAYKCHPEYKLILAANRDEFYQRPTLKLNYWPDSPSILAGRDLKGKGTWLGLTQAGRIAALTNYRDPSNQQANAPSRGRLITDYLKENQSPQKYAESLSLCCSAYNGFNILIGDKQKLLYFSNYLKAFEEVPSGIHGLSNHLLNTAWPKVLRGKKKLKAVISGRSQDLIEDLFSIMTDQVIPDDNQLPDTGVGITWERTLSPMFIVSPDYGTRCSSIVLIKHSGHIQFSERTYEPGTTPPVEASTQTFFIDPN